MAVMMSGRKGVRVTGRNEVLRKLNRQIRGIKGRTRAGVRSAALMVRRKSQLMCPVSHDKDNSGNLKRSAYTEVYDYRGIGPVAEIGYTAFYASYVHEMPDTYNFTTPGTGPKFLEQPLLDSVDEILKIIQKHAKV